MELDHDLLLQTFLDDADDHVEGLEEALLAWEQGARGEDQHQLLARHAHSLKGDASILELTAIVEVAHAIEDGLPCLFGDEARVVRAINALLRAVDVLRELLVQATQGAVSLTRAHTDVIAGLRALGARQPKADAQRAGGEAGAGATLEQPAPRAAARGTLRVEVERLDEMLRLAGEIAIARGRLSQVMQSGQSMAEALAVHREANRLHMDLQEMMMRARLVPLDPIFRRHLRTARDLGKQLGKRVRVEIDAGDVELDTSVVSQLHEPLMHMVRNAVAHGIEPAALRERAHKPAIGTLKLSARHDGGSILVRIEDDGAGLDPERILRRARALGLVDEHAPIAEAQLYRLILTPGFSTADEVTQIAGRGVGMDVVRASVEGLGGTLQIASTPGRGTLFQLRLPLTLAIIEGFGVQVGCETCVIPLDQVIECVELPSSAREAHDGSGILSLRGEALPFVRLRQLFGFDPGASGRENVVVVEHGGTRAGFVVDQLHGHLQTVIKPLHRMFQAVTGLSGSAIAGDGRVALILDVPSLVQEAVDGARTEAA